MQAYYKNSYTIGNSITIDSEGIDILGGNSETPIGYVAVDKQDRNPLYFLDMNVAKDEMTAIDFTNDNSKSVFSIRSFMDMNNISSIDSLSLLDMIDTNDTQRVQKAKFWGYSFEGGCNSFGYKYCCHYVFWIENGCGAQSC